MHTVKCCFNCAHGGIDLAIQVMLREARECEVTGLVVLPDSVCENWKRSPELDSSDGLKPVDGEVITDLHSPT